MSVYSLFQACYSFDVAPSAIFLLCLSVLVRTSTFSFMTLYWSQ